jgi:YesN/AraC family two-component response regulator
MSRFWLINEGYGTLRLQDREYFLKPGTIVSILPWQITDIFQVDAPLQYFLLAYYFDNINNIIKSVYNADYSSLTLIEDMTRAPVVYCNKEEFATVRNIFKQLQEEEGMESLLPTPYTDKFHSLFLKNKLIELIIHFLRIGTLKKPSVSLPKHTDIQKSDILHYMYNHLSQKLTLAHLSKLFYMSESSISAYITKTTGLSFFDLLNEMRVGKTINFLLYTNFTMEELAEILGFVDSSHICKVFSARVGMRANDFRKTYQNLSKMCDITISKKAYEIVCYIYRNFDQELTLQDTADKFLISTKELNSILLYQVEKNFSDFLNFIRVNRASELLKETNKSITDIAIDIGYNNAKTLTRNFLRYRTMTPSTFRLNIELQPDTL